MIATKDYLQKLYFKENKSFREIGKVLCVSEATVSLLFKKHDLKAKSFLESKIKRIDTSFFDYKKSEIAFVLGYIFANSYLSHSKTNRNKPFVKIHSINIHWLNQIRQLLGAEYKIGHRKPKLYNGKMCNEIFWLHLENPAIINSLITLGLTKNKANNFHFPLLPEKYFPDFIRGYWAGNGLITVRSNRPYIHLNSKSLSIIETIANFLSRKGMKSPAIEEVKRLRSTTFRLRYMEWNDIRMFYKIVYQNAPENCSFSEEIKKIKRII